MATSLQGDDNDEEERRVLEAELAAELAALSAFDVGFDDDMSASACEPVYVRLDLDTVLNHVTQVANMSNSDKHDVPTAWELLLQSVEQSDRDFFQPCRDNLHDIRLSILGSKSSITLEEDATWQVLPWSKESAQSMAEVAISHAALPLFSTTSTRCEEHFDECKQENDENKNENDSLVKKDLFEQRIDVSEPMLRDVSDSVETPDQVRQEKELETIAKQHKARELRRWQTQTQYENERNDVARQLHQLHEDFVMQEKLAAMSYREAQERSLMTYEEAQCRAYADTEREMHETELMTHADEASCKFEAELARIEDGIRKEVAHMTVEDQAGRWRLQEERQEASVRGRFGIVLMGLIEYHRACERMQDEQLNRERQECIEMLAQETSTRRVLEARRAYAEQLKREANALMMFHEDEVAKAREHSEQLQRLYEKKCLEGMEKEEKRCRCAWSHEVSLLQEQKEETCRLLMSQEDERCRRAWSYLAEKLDSEAKELEKRRRQTLLTACRALDRVVRQHETLACLGKWKWWQEQSKRVDQQRYEVAKHAAARIQTWYRSCRQQIGIETSLFVDDFTAKDDDVEAAVWANSLVNQEAALRLQSTFRGFHVRRKFANALALARAVEHDEDNYFESVDFDDLIEVPPELVDGWENPVLPLTFVCSSTHDEQRAQSLDNNVVDDEDCGKSIETSAHGITGSRTSALPEEHNLAATLWNKMRRVKQRQQRTQQERQCQRDPIYRVQKLLHRKSKAFTTENGRGSDNQSSETQKAPRLISWSMTSTTKKRPKVKLPSLVERLRRQAMAER